MIDISFDWDWVVRNWSGGMRIGSLLIEHVLLSIIPVVAAVIISIPLGYLIFLTKRAANPLLALLGVIYSVPSLALFVALPAVIPTSILSPVNVGVALAIYSIALLVRNVVDGLRSVPDTVKQSASALGYGWFRRLLVIEIGRAHV